MVCSERRSRSRRGTEAPQEDGRVDVWPHQPRGTVQLMRGSGEGSEPARIKRRAALIPVLDVRRGGSVLGCLRIEGIPQSIAEEVQGEEGQGEEQAWQDKQLGIGLQVVGALFDQNAPGTVG